MINQSAVTCVWQYCLIHCYFVPLGRLFLIRSLPLVIADVSRRVWLVHSPVQALPFTVRVKPLLVAACVTWRICQTFSCCVNLKNETWHLIITKLHKVNSIIHKYAKDLKFSDCLNKPYLPKIEFWKNLNSVWYSMAVTKKTDAHLV